MSRELHLLKKRINRNSQEKASSHGGFKKRTKGARTALSARFGKWGRSTPGQSCPRSSSAAAPPQRLNHGFNDRHLAEFLFFVRWGGRRSLLCVSATPGQ